MASLATLPVLSDRRHCRGLLVWRPLEPADRDDLVLGHDLDGEGKGAAAQDGVWVIVGPL